MFKNLLSKLLKIFHLKPKNQHKNMAKYHRVKGHFKRSGWSITYVRPHTQRNPRRRK
jgi:hypothetical protein